MIDKETYKREFIRMMDSIRVEEKTKGKPNCAGMSCDECPLNGTCEGINAYLAFELIECVEKWTKEHPVITMADKFKEVFGVEPKNAADFLCCPETIGFTHNGCAKKDCRYCKEQFWTSEYKAPEKKEADDDV